MTQAPWPPPSVEHKPKRSLLSILLLWIGCYLTAVVLSVAVMSITSTSIGGDANAADNPTTLFLALSALALWLPFVFMLRWVARRAGTDFRTYFGLRFT